MNRRLALRFILVLAATATCMYVFVYLMSTGMTRVGSALVAFGLLLVLAAIAFFVEKRMHSRH